MHAQHHSFQRLRIHASAGFKFRNVHVYLRQLGRVARDHGRQGFVNQPANIDNYDGVRGRQIFDGTCRWICSCSLRRNRITWRPESEEQRYQRGD